MKAGFKRAILYMIVVFVLVSIVGIEYQAQIRDIEQRYKEKHRITTDDEIETYEYVFAIKCDSTCYH
jgi:hypothetical protein